MWPPCVSFASYSIMHTIRFLGSPILCTRLFNLSYFFRDKYIYIYIYHCLYCHASWSRTFEIVFFLFPFHEIFNEGTKEKKSACMYVAFAYDLILLFFVTWVSQIYLVSNIESIHKEHRWSRGWNLDEESGSKNRYLDP